MADEGNGGGEYQRAVLGRLDRLDSDVGMVRTDIGDLRETVGSMCESVAGLRVRAGAWGAIAGLIPVVIALGIALARSFLP